MENNIQTFTCPGNLFLFGVNNNGSVLYGQHEIYFCKIYDNGILIRNLIPCYRKSDNEIGMYDTVNDVFYTNSGTGTFLKGNNVIIDGVGDEVNYSDIPETYQEVEYIESTGTQYIDTGIKVTNNIGTYLDAQYLLNNNGVILCGMEVGTARFIPYQLTPNLGYRSFNGIDVNNYIILSSDTADLERHTFEFNTTTDREIKFDGVHKGIAGNIGNVNINILIFARNLSNNFSLWASARLYSLKLYNNGNIVRDFIPCYRKSDNVIGLYDKVNDVFYTNSGTGTFLKGNNKVKYKIPIQTIPELRSEYQQVEYIESTGTQYINTGLVSSNDVFVFDFVASSTNTATNPKMIIGADRGFNVSVVSSKYRSTSSCVSTISANINTPVHIILTTNPSSNSLLLKIDESTFSGTYNQFIFNGAIGLFAIGDGNYKSSSRIYSATIYKNNVKIANFIPCYRLSDNVIGMYDTVNNVFYTNSGTGTFLKGNDIYEDNNTEYIYLDEPLRKVGTFADYLDYKNQKIYRNIIVNNDSSYSTTIDTTGTDITLPPLPTKKNDVTTLSVYTKIKPTAYIKYKGH